MSVMGFHKKIGWGQCFMQRPVHPSYGRVKLNLDGCLFVCGRVWTGKKKKKKIFFFIKILCIPVSSTWNCSECFTERFTRHVIVILYRRVCIS